MKVRPLPGLFFMFLSGGGRALCFTDASSLPPPFTTSTAWWTKASAMLAPAIAANAPHIYSVLKTLVLIADSKAVLHVTSLCWLVIHRRGTASAHPCDTQGALHCPFSAKQEHLGEKYTGNVKILLKTQAAAQGSWLCRPITSACAYSVATSLCFTLPHAARTRCLNKV